MNNNLQSKSFKTTEVVFWKAHSKRYFLHFTLLLVSTLIVVPTLLPLYFKFVEVLYKTMTNELMFTITNIITAFIALYLMVSLVSLVTFKVTKSVLANHLNLRDKQLKKKSIFYHFTRIATIYFLFTYLFMYLIITLSF